MLGVDGDGEEGGAVDEGPPEKQILYFHLLFCQYPAFERRGLSLYATLPLHYRGAVHWPIRSSDLILSPS